MIFLCALSCFWPIYCSWLILRLQQRPSAVLLSITSDSLAHGSFYLQCKIVNLLFVDFPCCHCYVMLLLVANVCFLSLYIYTVDVDTVSHMHILTASFQVNVGDPFAHWFSSSICLEWELMGMIVAVWMHFLSLRHSVKALEGTQTTDISQEQSRQSFFLYW